MMLKHENPNIEIINKNLWAVRFALLPMIPQISYKPDPAVPIEQVPGQLAPGGLMILNKDFKAYEFVKKATLSAMRLNPRQIKKELDYQRENAVSSPNQTIWRYCLVAELERKKSKKGGVT